MVSADCETTSEIVPHSSPGTSNLRPQLAPRWGRFFCHSQVQSRPLSNGVRTRETPSEGGIEAGQVGGVIRASLDGTLGTSLDPWLPIDSGKVKFRPVGALLLTTCPQIVAKGATADLWHPNETASVYARAGAVSLVARATLQARQIPDP